MKIKISISLMLLSLFCSVSVFSQVKTTDSEKLVTEFIKLENVPSCPNGTYEKGGQIKSVCEDYVIGYLKLINFIKLQLSRRGTIELDKRSNTLIITETKKNLTVIKDLITVYDYSDIYKISEEEFNNYKKSKYYYKVQETCSPIVGCRNK
jgi:type II secretory pathway component GspD/PulD (secretin)